MGRRILPLALLHGVPAASMVSPLRGRLVPGPGPQRIGWRRVLALARPLLGGPRRRAPPRLLPLATAVPVQRRTTLQAFAAAPLTGGVHCGCAS